MKTEFLDGIHSFGLNCSNKSISISQFAHVCLNCHTHLFEVENDAAGRVQEGGHGQEESQGQEVPVVRQVGGILPGWSAAVMIGEFLFSPEDDSHAWADEERI